MKKTHNKINKMLIKKNKNEYKILKKTIIGSR